jgi:hypothetical protein
VRGRIARSQGATKDEVGRGLARAFRGGLLYQGEEGSSAAEAPAGAGAGTGRGAGGPSVPEEVAAELVGRHLGLHVLRGAAGPDGGLPPGVTDPVAHMMSAWFQPRVGG